MIGYSGGPNSREINILFRRTLRRLALIPILAVSLGGCASLPVGLSALAPQVADDCAPAVELNSAFNWLLVQSGAGFGKSELMDPAEGPFLAVTPNALNPAELREVLAKSCVYESQENAPGFDADGAWFVVSDVEVAHATVEQALGSCAIRPNALQDYTDVVQGNPEIVGGYVEEFSLGLAEIFPNAKYAAFIQKC